MRSAAYCLPSPRFSRLAVIALLALRLLCADYWGPEWRDFSVASLTSFARLETKMRHADCSDAEIAAAKHAAALGCTDHEVGQAVDDAREHDENVVQWRRERGGIDEPAAWVAARGVVDQLYALLDQPGGPHERLQFVLPQLEREGDTGVTVGHLYALLDVAARVAQARDCTQSAVFYCWAYHLCRGPRAPGLEPPRFWTHRTGRVAPLPQEGPRELEPTPHAKAMHTRFKRLRETYEKERKAACKRRDLSAARGSVASALRAEAEIARLDRGTRVLVSPGDLRPEKERALMLKRAREPPWTGPFFEAPLPCLHVGPMSDWEREWKLGLGYREEVCCGCNLCGKCPSYMVSGQGCGWGQTTSPCTHEQDRPMPGYVGPHDDLGLYSDVLR